MDGAHCDQGRSELALKLPFYANGTLSAPERAAIEAALAADADLRTELALVREVQALVRRGGLAIGAPGDMRHRLGLLLRRLGPGPPSGP